MDTHDKERRMHFVLPSDHGPTGLWMTQEEIAIVNKMLKAYPDKYKGAEGVMQAIIDYHNQG